MVLVMQSEKRGVKIDQTLGLQRLSVLYEIAYTRIMHACFWAFWLSYLYRTYYSLTERVSRAPRSLIFAFQWLHSAYSYSVCLCTSILTHWSVLIPNILYSIFPDFPSIREGAGLIVLHK